MLHSSFSLATLESPCKLHSEQPFVSKFRHTRVCKLKKKKHLNCLYWEINAVGVPNTMCIFNLPYLKIHHNANCFHFILLDLCKGFAKLVKMVLDMLLCMKFCRTKIGMLGTNRLTICLVLTHETDFELCKIIHLNKLDLI